MNHPGRPGCTATAPPVDSPPPLEAQDVTLDSPQAPPTPSQALSLVDPETWASVGALSQTDSACWPAFIFLFKTLLDKRAFGFKRSESYFSELVLWENGRKRRRHRAVCHNVVDFNIGCKITNAYNKQNIYSVLKS